MRKILLSLIAVAAFPSSVMAVDNSQMRTCGLIAPQTYDCTPLVLDIDNSVPPFNWEDAKKLCASHETLTSCDSEDECRVDYEQKFSDSCKAVDAHFEEERHRQAVADEIKKSARDQKDLERLNDFLAGSAAK